MKTESLFNTKQEKRRLEFWRVIAINEVVAKLRAAKEDSAIIVDISELRG